MFLSTFSTNLTVNSYDGLYSPQNPILLSALENASSKLYMEENRNLNHVSSKLEDKETKCKFALSAESYKLNLWSFTVLWFKRERGWMLDKNGRSLLEEEGRGFTTKVSTSYLT